MKTSIQPALVDLGDQHGRKGFRPWLVAGVWGLAMMAVGFALGIHVTPQPQMAPVTQPSQPLVPKITPEVAAKAKAFLSKRMPNTDFVRVEADRDVPTLLRIQTATEMVPMLFDPLRNILILGMAIDLENANQTIAPGNSTGF
ncbi:hypothetical protein [Sinimarinibacterium sp. NLF-5-8]|uniref:hypothetical protein n=1 Tax=Sinimarinibacterium sp. NLF-5-8 TaxID=2698684 RepID=UPI00137C042D|nr:hypothetical protein [Sinimarinibacterium sp. NLF-5-8]QHS09085.1 hypothetical protein GT972_02255 [Sinimarinibacterium sp. NLF-5-8]